MQSLKFRLFNTEKSNPYHSDEDFPINKAHSRVSPGDGSNILQVRLNEHHGSLNVVLWGTGLFLDSFVLIFLIFVLPIRW